MTDEEYLVEIEACPVVEDVPWLIERVRVLTAERDDLIVERDKWKTRVTG